MKRYKVSLTRHGCHWCEIVIEGREPDKALADTIGRFPAEDGFVLSICEETEQCRIVEVGATARVLSVTYEKTPIDVATAVNTGGDRQSRPSTTNRV